ncbi:hypothetical protein [uncultured Sulfitobacter sp.]|uniref:Hint domain-containing protein n=1 Tax=uncultured Sulfitobacter sp. TaxID=191468 RepID=UPI003451E376
MRTKHLVATSAGIRIAKGKRKLRYIYLLFNAHQIIFANGAPLKSLHPAQHQQAKRQRLLGTPRDISRTDVSYPCRQNTLRHYGQTARFRMSM